MGQIKQIMDWSYVKTMGGRLKTLKSIGDKHLLRIWKNHRLVKCKYIFLGENLKQKLILPILVDYSIRP